MSSYNPEADPELYHPLTMDTGAYWGQKGKWAGRIVMVLAPSERRERWQVSWTGEGRGALGRGDTFLEACSDLHSDCLWPAALATLGGYVQAVRAGHPSAQGPILPALPAAVELLKEATDG